MTDITSLNLEAAFIDQMVAGAFLGKKYAYTAITADKGYRLSIAVANERGHCPIDGKTFDKYEDAQTWARDLNKHIGLTDDEAISIVVSTMGGRRHGRAA